MNDGVCSSPESLIRFIHLVCISVWRPEKMVQKIFFFLFWIPEVVLGRGRDVRSTDLNNGPFYNSDGTDRHQFAWRRSTGLQFDEQIGRSLGSSDFLYVFTGDTQHWHPCTADNLACQRETDFCATRESSSGIECHKKQSEFSNKLQQISIAALNRRLNVATGRQAIKGIIINGDLTEFGHEDELNRLKNLWTTSLFDNSLKIYPGLGNHDYDNNVGECTLDHCVNRMLRWFRSYVKDTLKFPIDLRTSSKFLVAEENSGSFAYSWDECQSSACFHFIQLNNYPTYAKHVDGWLLDWKILSSLNWLTNDLRREGANKSIILNFHDFDTSFSPADKSRFRNILDTAVSNSGNTRILAIFFAHIHERVGLKEFWCINGRRVPLIYSGSVPGNNYILAHLSPATGTVKAFYAIHVGSEMISYADTEPIAADQEPCMR